MMTMFLPKPSIYLTKPQCQAWETFLVVGQESARDFPEQHRFLPLLSQSSRKRTLGYC